MRADKSWDRNWQKWLSPTRHCAITTVARLMAERVQTTRRTETSVNCSVTVSMEVSSQSNAILLKGKLLLVSRCRVPWSCWCSHPRFTKKTKCFLLQSHLSFILFFLQTHPIISKITPWVLKSCELSL